MPVVLHGFLSSLFKPVRILVAVSGGSDSTGLLVGLVDALASGSFSGVSLCAAIVDHGLRAQSADEACSVAALCKAHGVPHRILRWQGAKPKTGVMAAAREARYDLLLQAAAGFNADLAVTGHTFDDQRETLQMRARRSSLPPPGIADLMLFNRRLWVARPLLGCSRADIRDFLIARGIGWIDDPSNMDEVYERVRVRNELAGGSDACLPTVPIPEPARVAADAAFWLSAHFVLHRDGVGQIRLGGLAAEPATLGYGLSRLAAVFGGRSYPPSTAQTARLLQFAASGETQRIALSGSVIERRRDGLYLAREARGLPRLVLRSGESGIWDGRFTIENQTAGAVIVGPGGDNAIGESAGAGAGEDPHLPSRSLKLARGALPYIERAPKDMGLIDQQEGVGFGGPYAAVAQRNPADGVRITPYFAPFDRFLTRSDAIFAQSLAKQWSAPGYPWPPMDLIDGKSV